MAGDHGKAGGAAIHLVDLPDEAHAPHASRALDESPVLLEWRFVGGDPVRLVDLIVADLFLGVGTCRKKLTIDARRRLRPSPVVVLRDALVDPVAKLRELVCE